MPNVCRDMLDRIDAIAFILVNHYRMTSFDVNDLILDELERDSSPTDMQIAARVATRIMQA